MYIYIYFLLLNVLRGLIFADFLDPKYSWDKFSCFFLQKPSRKLILLKSNPLLIFLAALSRWTPLSMLSDPTVWFSRNKWPHNDRCVPPHFFRYIAPISRSGIPKNDTHFGGNNDPFLGKRG